MWTRTWDVSELRWEKVLEHTSQMYGFSPVWTRLCLTRSPFFKNCLLQTSHLYGFSPVCIRKCVFRLPFPVNSFLHTSHPKLFCLVWIRLCIIRFRRRWNCLPHKWHTCCFTSLTVPQSPSSQCFSCLESVTTVSLPKSVSTLLSISQSNCADWNLFLEDSSW